MAWYKIIGSKKQYATEIITKKISGKYKNDIAVVISPYAFFNCSSLTSVSFPLVQTIGISAFYSCSALTSVSFPSVATIGSNAFYSCSRLTSVSFPLAQQIGTYAFYSCYRLISLFLPGDAVCVLSGSTAFGSTPIGGYRALAQSYGTIYVPSSLLTSYQTATNWTYFSSRFSAIENYIPE